MKLLKDLYKNHFGKVTHKWSIYFDQYEYKLSPYKKLPIKLFEIGVENGGSLEIFSKYFSNAELLLGCDIQPKCGELIYDKSNIKVLVGDVNDEKTKVEIIKCSKFDIIIDDGSHGSVDIVKAFCNYFNYLKDDGLFIIEDLHCSYWEEWGGGIFYPLSSINFFKKLIDIINYEHWGVQKQKDWLLREFSFNYKIDIEKLALEQIHSIEFVNSLCFIKKKPLKENQLGKRVVAGKIATVYPDALKANNQPSVNLNESKNLWSNQNLLPTEELFFCQEKVEKLKKQVSDLEKEIQNLKN